MALYEKQVDGSYKKISQIYIGKSAYDIAVDNGFKGTEQDWLATLRTASTYIVSVPITGWSTSAPHSITIPTMGILPTDQIFWDVELNSSDSASIVETAIKSYNLVDKIEAGTNIITLYCWSGTPITEFNLKVVAVHATRT